MRLVFALTCWGMLSCTSLRRVTPEPHSVFEEIEPRDVVDVLFNDGERIRSCSLHAIDSSNLTLRVPRAFKSEIRQVSRDSVRYIEIRTTKARLVQPIKGKTVRVTLHDGRVIEPFKVMHVDSNKIVGQTRIKESHVTKMYLFDLSVKSINHKKVELLVPRSEISAIHTISPVPGQHIVQLKKGRTVQVTLNDGTVIQQLKVLDYDSGEIKFKQIKDFHKSVQVTLSRSKIVFMKTDIFSIGKTIALVIPLAASVWVGAGFVEVNSSLSKMSMK